MRHSGDTFTTRHERTRRAVDKLSAISTRRLKHWRALSAVRFVLHLVAFCGAYFLFAESVVRVCAQDSGGGYVSSPRGSYVLC